MQTSIVIAKLLGPFLTVTGAGILIDRDAFVAMAAEYVRTPALVYMAGIMALATGLPIVVVHNVWTLGWPVIITVFGWLAVAAGIVRMTVPGRLSKLGAGMLARREFLVGAAVAYVAIGGFLTLIGYGLIG